jgi:predicted NAD/FAD-dependent oxidoreductase
LAGLAAGRELAARGHEVLVLEKSRGVGGRIASRRVGGTVVDHGSPVVDAPPGSALAAVAAELPAGERIRLADGLAMPAGLTRLPKMLAGGLDLRLGVRVAALRQARGGLEVADEQGNAHGAVDAVVVAAPAPQAADLLERGPEPARAAALRRLTYLPAVMVLAGVRLASPPGDGAPLAAPDPLAEVRREDAKGRPAAGGIVPVVARLGQEASTRLLDAADEEVLARALPALAAALGSAAADPEWAQVKRWRYAVPAGRLDRDAVNPPGCRVVVAGDAVAGAGFGAHRHAEVFASGLWAAGRVAAAGAAAA